MSGIAVKASSDRPVTSAFDPEGSTHPRLWFIYVAGRLDAGLAVRVLRLLDARLELIQAGLADKTHVVIDLAATTTIDAGGVATLRHAPFEAARLGVTVWLSGVTGRTDRLPTRSRSMLDRIRMFPDEEAAVLAYTTGATTADAAGRRAGRGVAT